MIGFPRFSFYFSSTELHYQIPACPVTTAGWGLHNCSATRWLPETLIWTPLITIPLHLFNGLFSRMKWVSRCKKGRTTHTHPFNGSFSVFPRLPRSAGTRKVKPMWISLKQETVSGSDISWAICKSAPCSRQTTRPAPHHSVFCRPDALPVAQPTASKH